MAFTKLGILSLSFIDSKVSQPSLFFPQSSYFLRITFGHQHFVTSSFSSPENNFYWPDSMRFTKQNEEALTLECFCEDGSGRKRIGSAMIPIQTVVESGLFKGSILLMNMGKVTVRVGVEMRFEEKQENKRQYPTTLYPVAPPELPHVHAYAVPENFIYTPPGYYQAKNEGDLIFN
jgi:hypothetical protein